MTTHDELAIALAAEAPRPRPEFAARLDERVAAGFARKRRLPSLPPLAILGGATAAVVAVIVAVSLVGNDGSHRTAGAGDKLSPTAELKADSRTSAGAAAQTAPAIKAPAPARQTPRHV